MLILIIFNKVKQWLLWKGCNCNKFIYFLWLILNYTNCLKFLSNWHIIVTRNVRWIINDNGIIKASRRRNNLIVNKSAHDNVLEKQGIFLKTSLERWTSPRETTSNDAFTKVIFVHHLYMNCAISEHRTNSADIV